jgi:hypothetical protein
MKIKDILSVFAIVTATFVFSACPFESDLEITRAEYTSKNTFTVYYIGNMGGIPNFTVEGKDKRYNSKSSTSMTLFDTEVKCEIEGEFIKGDHITVTSNDLPGSAEFDVPD